MSFDLEVKVISANLKYQDGDYDGGTNKPDPILFVTDDAFKEHFFMPQIGGQDLTDKTQVDLQDLDNPFNLLADWSDVSDDNVMTLCDFTGDAMVFTLVDNDGSEDELKNKMILNRVNGHMDESWYETYNQIGDLRVPIPTTADKSKVWWRVMYMNEDIGHFPEAPSVGDKTAKLKFSYRRYDSTRAHDCVCKVGNPVSGVKSMLYNYQYREYKKDENGEIFTSEWKEETGDGFYCVDALDDGTLAASYEIEPLHWSPDDFLVEPEFVDVTPSPTTDDSNWRIHIDESGSTLFWTGPTELRLADPYNASTKTCCERKKEGNNATSCPWIGSNSERNWYVPVPNDCAINTLTRVIKNKQNTGGFLS
jgi:hypothetical protein